MVKYTTPTIHLIVEGVDITDKDIYVTLEQGNIELSKTGSDLTVTAITEEQNTDTDITFVLTQEETGQLNPCRNVMIQVNWIASNGVRAATEIKAIGVMQNLLDEVIDYGN